MAPSLLPRLATRMRLAGGLLTVALAATAAAQSAPPNIVLVIADDLGYADVGCFGAPAIATPAIDALALEGARLTSFYVHPTCSPTRAALMTGKYARRVGVNGPLGIWSDFGLPAAELTLAERLRARGYRTGFFGKWHLGDSPEQLPLNQGFDDWFGTPWGLLGRPDLLMDSRGADEWSDDLTTWTRRFTDRTLEFIEESAASGEPFLAVLSHHVPHYPATVGRDFIGVSADGREYGDAVEELDAGVGEIVALLESLDLADDTLVMFFSDNGPVIALGAYQAGSAGPFRGWKGSTLEGGVRVPCVVRWPAAIPAGLEVQAPVHVTDVLPTILSIVGGASPTAGELDGRDVQRLLEGGLLPPAEDIVYYPGSGTTVDGVRRGALKYRNGELYDLDLDPGEMVDIAPIEPLIAAELDGLRAALELDLALSAQPPAPTSRRRPTWRADQGLGPATVLAGGQLWQDERQGHAPWIVIDQDPLFDLERVPTPATRPAIAPTRAIRAQAASPDLRLEREGTEFIGLSGGPFSLAVWLRLDPQVVGRSGAVLDIGDEQRGVSITIDDLGLLGDEYAPGLQDDVRVRVGGAASPGCATFDLDLPGGGDLHLLLFTVSSGGRMTVYLDAIVVGVVDAGAAVHWGGESNWTLLGVGGELGGDGGAGVLPPAVTTGVAEVAGLRVWDRAIANYEAEAEYARYGAYRYCGGQESSLGERVVLDLYGSFLPSDVALRARVTGLPPGSIGILLAGGDQGRMPLGPSYYCIAGPPLRLRVAAPAPGTDFVDVPVLEPGLYGYTWTPTPGTRWSLQFLYRDAGLFRSSSAISALMGS